MTQPVELVDFVVNQVRRRTPKEGKPYWVGAIRTSGGEVVVCHRKHGSWVHQRNGTMRHLLPSVAEALQARVLKLEKEERRAAKRAEANA